MCSRSSRRRAASKSVVPDQRRCARHARALRSRAAVRQRRKLVAAPRGVARAAFRPQRARAAPGRLACPSAAVRGTRHLRAQARRIGARVKAGIQPLAQTFTSTSERQRVRDRHRRRAERRTHAAAVQRHRRQHRDDGAFHRLLLAHARRRLRCAGRRRIAGTLAALSSARRRATRRPTCSTHLGIDARRRVRRLVGRCGGAGVRDPPSAPLPHAHAGGHLRGLRHGAGHGSRCC